MVKKQTYIPVSNIVPLVFREGASLLELIHGLAKYVQDTLEPSLKHVVDGVVAEVESQMDEAKANYVAGVQEFQRIHDAFMSDVNAKLMALNDSAMTDLTSDEESLFGKTIRELFIQEADELVQPTGSWVFKTPRVLDNDDRNMIVLEREFIQDQGDRYNSTTRLEMSINRQQPSPNNPPGYAMATLDLIDDRAEPDPNEGGARMAIISSRFLFNKRLEVNMGGSARATLRSGTTPGMELLRLSLHNKTYPQINLFGPDHKGEGDPESVTINRGTLRIFRGANNRQMSIIPPNDDSGRGRRADFMSWVDGRFGMQASVSGEALQGFLWDPEDGRLVFNANRGVRFQGAPIMNASRGIIMPSANGTEWRLRVTNIGNLVVEEA